VVASGLSKTAVKLATRVTYRQAAFIVKEVLGGVRLSVVGLWKQVQQAGAMAGKIAERRRQPGSGVASSYTLQPTRSDRPAAVPVASPSGWR